MLKKYYYLSPLQKIDIAISTLFFSIFICFLRPLLITNNFDSKNMIAYTMIFFAWYGCTLLFSNAFTYDEMYNKINNI